MMQPRKRIRLALGAVVLLLTVVATAAGPGVGEIIRSSNTSINGVAVPVQGTVTPGAVLKTAADGSALVQFSTETQINLSGNTSVSFRTDDNRLTAEMSAGTVGAKSLGKDPLAVETPQFRIEPSMQKAIYVVALLPDQTTIVSARQGSVTVVQKASGEKYVVSEGRYARVASGDPPVPPEPTPRQAGGPPKGLGNSPTKLIILSAGAGVGLALILAYTVLEPAPISPSAP